MPRIRYGKAYFKIGLDGQLVLMVAMFFPPSILPLCIEPLGNGDFLLWRGDQAAFDSSCVDCNTKLRFVLTCLIQIYAPRANSREVAFECGDDAALLS